MPVTMEQVVARLSRDEPDYDEAVQLGEEAVPHLMRLVEEGDPALASKATYLAAAINTEQSTAVVNTAARSSLSVVRVAAAASLGRLKGIPISLVSSLLKDQDIGVRKWTLKSLAISHPTGIKARVQETATSDPDMMLRQLASRIVDQLQ
jgi:hypothetical protein